MTMLTSSNFDKTDIREYLKTHHVPQWKVANALGVGEMTLTRKLRINFQKSSDDEKEIIIKVINDLVVDSNSNL